MTTETYFVAVHRDKMAKRAPFICIDSMAGTRKIAIRSFIYFTNVLGKTKDESPMAQFTHKYCEEKFKTQYIPLGWRIEKCTVTVN